MRPDVTGTVAIAATERRLSGTVAAGRGDWTQLGEGLPTVGGNMPRRWEEARDARWLGEREVSEGSIDESRKSLRPCSAALQVPRATGPIVGSQRGY